MAYISFSGYNLNPGPSEVISHVSTAVREATVRDLNNDPMAVTITYRPWSSNNTVDVGRDPVYNGGARAFRLEAGSSVYNEPQGALCVVAAFDIETHGDAEVTLSITTDLEGTVPGSSFTAFKASFYASLDETEGPTISASGGVGGAGVSGMKSFANLARYRCLTFAWDASGCHLYVDDELVAESATAYSALEGGLVLSAKDVSIINASFQTGPAITPASIYSEALEFYRLETQPDPGGNAPTGFTWTGQEGVTGYVVRLEQAGVVTETKLPAGTTAFDFPDGFDGRAQIVAVNASGRSTPVDVPL